jgi:proline dehydrogenase
MPGETLDEALRAAVVQQRRGARSILTCLGENVSDLGEAEAVTEHYLGVLEKAAEAGLDAHLAVKPTQLGLDQDAGQCAANLDRLLARAARNGSVVWLDMESSRYVDPTLALYRRARERSDRVGVALQAYLHRTPKDVEDLIPLGAAVRLVKGAYLESPSLAHPRKRDVDESFHRLACRLLAEDARRPGALVHVATHDAGICDRLLRFVDDRQVPPSAYEFAMLYGIQHRLQERLAGAGRRLRVLISYGEHWFPWYMRRLAERPANVLFVVKSMVT